MSVVFEFLPNKSQETYLDFVLTGKLLKPNLNQTNLKSFKLAFLDAFKVVSIISKQFKNSVFLFLIIN